MKIQNLLEDSKRNFHTIDQERTVGQALKMMSGYSVSALVVTIPESSPGIFTERDLVRCHILFPDKEISTIVIEDVMTTKLIVAEPEDTIEAAMGMMIQAKIRHLPVVSNGQISALLGLEDLVKRHVGDLTRELHYLQDYISDLQDAAND